MNTSIKKIFLSIFLTILFGYNLFAQNSVVGDSVRQNKYNFSQFWDETVNFIKQPAKWDGNDWLKIGLINAGTFLIIETADQPIRNSVLENQKHSKSCPMELGRIWGDIYAPVLLFGGFAIHSWLTDNVGNGKIAYEIGQASIYVGVVAYIMKLAIGRTRPYMEKGTTSFHPFSSFFVQDYHSFPSGHNTEAFVLSTVLSRNAKPVWLKVLAYLPAALTFVSRVYQDKHWTSDNFFGAALGYFVATWVVDQHENTKSIVEISSVYPLTIKIALN